MEKVLVAMSGGVDSSVALALLKKAGYEPYGVTMSLLNGIKGVEPSEEYKAAEAVAEKLSLPFECVDYSREFEENVVKKFVSSYLNGETPNPCVECNKYLKLGRLFEKADELGIKYVATGHYARVENHGGEYRLRKAVDSNKDQSYVLCNLNQKQLSRLILPLGGMTKAEIREIAEKENLPNSHKAESQDICFIKNGEFYDFVSLYSGKEQKSGNFVDKSGRVIGKHNGSVKYTIGQRRGLGMGFGEKAYVISKNTKTNTVTIGSNDDLFRTDFYMKNVSFTSGNIPAEVFRASVKIRYKHTESPASVTPAGDGLFFVRFDTPQRAIAPGQWGVMYDGEYVIGGGVIDRVL